MNVRTSLSINICNYLCSGFRNTVRHFEYCGLAVLMDILFQYKKSRRIEVGLHGLSPECLAVANHVGLERVLKG